MVKGSVAMLFGISTPNHFAHRCKRYKIRRTLQLETEVLEDGKQGRVGWNRFLGSEACLPSLFHGASSIRVGG